MASRRETRYFFNDFFRPAGVGGPDTARSEDIGDSVEATDLVVTPRGGKLLHGDTHCPHLVDQGRPTRLLFHDDTVRLPLFIQPDRRLLEFGELHAFPEGVKEDDVGLLHPGIVGLVEDSPRCLRGIVRPLGLLEGRIPRHERKLAVGGHIRGPLLPPLSLDDGAGFANRVLEVLSRPFAVRQLFF